MDDTHNMDQDKAGPALGEQAHELQGRFPNDASLQDALGRLTLIGFDHADFSIPDPNSASDTPDQGASAATDDIDKSQLRTMASGMGGVAAGMAVAGAMMATGGLAGPLIAAAAGVSAIGTSAATSGAGVLASQAGSKERDRWGAEGKLILGVRLRSAEKMRAAEQAMREAGATEVTAVSRAEQAVTRGVNASSWTGG